jgi:hypothetical protein
MWWNMMTVGWSAARSWPNPNLQGAIIDEKEIELSAEH